MISGLSAKTHTTSCKRLRFNYLLISGMAETQNTTHIQENQFQLSFDFWAALLLRIDYCRLYRFQLSFDFWLSTPGRVDWPLISEDDVVHVEFRDSDMYVYLRNGGVYRVYTYAKYEKKYTLEYDDRRVVEYI